MAQRIGLLLSLSWVGDGKRRLHVYALGCLVDHKVDFACYLGSGSVDYGVCGDHSHVYRISSAHQFVEYDVFHEMGRLDLPEIDFRVSYARVRRIVFKMACEMLVSLYVIALRFVDEKCIFKVGKILCYRYVIGLDLQGCGYRICKFGRVDEASNVAHCGVCKHGKKTVVFEIVPFRHVFDVDRLDEICEIDALFCIRIEKRTFGKAAKCEVRVNDFPELCGLLHQWVKLCEGQWIDFDYLASSTKLGCDIARKKSGIGAGNVGADIVALEKPVEDMVECDVGVFAVFGAES